MNQLLLDRMDSLAQDSPHVIADQFEPVPGEKPAAPVPITKLTASTEEEILQTIKDYADYNLVRNIKILFKYCTISFLRNLIFELSLIFIYTKT